MGSSFANMSPTSTDCFHVIMRPSNATSPEGKPSGAVGRYVVMGQSTQTNSATHASAKRNLFIANLLDAIMIAGRHAHNSI
jgi:hypothetical protein